MIITRHLATKVSMSAPTFTSPGLVPPVVAQKLMGDSGDILILVMILMAVTSTGSAEVVAVTSILVYDIYQLYLRVIINTFARVTSVDRGR